MKLPILFMGIVMLALPAFAEESALKLTERKTCADISSEIAKLSAVENPDEATLATLKQLQTQHRVNCVAKVAGRRTFARNLPVNLIKVAEAPVVVPDALSEYMAAKKSNCEKLNTEIEKLATENDEAKADELASLRGVYDMDCVEKPATPEEATTTEQPEEEKVSEYDANLAAGLCGDGTKPNKYGCCTGEVFKDLGNTEFACCPKSGGDCFPPIK